MEMANSAKWMFPWLAILSLAHQMASFHEGCGHVMHQRKERA